VQYEIWITSQYISDINDRTETTNPIEPTALQAIDSWGLSCLLLWFYTSDADFWYRPFLLRLYRELLCDHKLNPLHYCSVRNTALKHERFVFQLNSNNAIVCFSQPTLSSPMPRELFDLMVSGFTPLAQRISVQEFGHKCELYLKRLDYRSEKQIEHEAEKDNAYVNEKMNQHREKGKQIMDKLNERDQKRSERIQQLLDLQDELENKIKLCHHEQAPGCCDFLCNTTARLVQDPCETSLRMLQIHRLFQPSLTSCV
jgi:hypothetical protein